MIKTINIAGREIGPTKPPYIIAEVSGNHNGDINRAIDLIRIANECGADAVKLQTYTADSLTINTDREEFTLKAGTWKGRNLYQLYTEAHTPWEWFPVLYEEARKTGITIFSSPFDQDAVDLLENLKSPAYKIASNEILDFALVKRVVETRKPIILSTGTAYKTDVADVLDFIKENGGRDVAVLHCVSAYPAPACDSNLRTMDDIANSFDVVCGLSDHTLGTATAVAAVARGASIIEKHITLSRDDGGPDSSFSLEPDDLKSLCRDVKDAWNSIGGVLYGGETDLQKKNIFTRQYWSIVEIQEGEILTPDNIKSIRGPSDSGGISARYYSDLFGKRAQTKIKKHSPITASDLVSD